MKNPSKPTAKETIASLVKGTAIDFNWCLQFFERNGTALFGQHFHIVPGDHTVIYRLLMYFLGHEKEAEALGLDLNKGILLTGPVGCGKTSWLKLMRLVTPATSQYGFKSCRDITMEFCRDGYDVIYRYSHQTLFSHKHYCFDDLGVEHQLKYYGNECNVMGEILLTRYDLALSAGMITHVSTNQSASELEELYGNRLRSRMRQMFNLVAFAGDSADKRK